MCTYGQRGLATRGGIILGGALKELEDALVEYYGTLNEVKHGLNAQPNEKPHELILYEQMQEMHVPLVAGGLMDQPHIWLQQYAVVRNVKALFDNLAQQTPGSSQGTGGSK